MLPSNFKESLTAPTVLEFDEHPSVDPAQAFPLRHRADTTQFTLKSLGLALERSGFGLVVWHELQKMRNEQTDVIPY